MKALRLPDYLVLQVLCLALLSIDVISAGALSATSNRPQSPISPEQHQSCASLVSCLGPPSHTSEHHFHFRNLRLTLTAPHISLSFRQTDPCAKHVITVTFRYCSCSRSVQLQMDAANRAGSCTGE